MSLRPPPPSRSPWQLFYGAVHRLRVAWYRDRAARLPRPVVSVGNLSWGGAGKTPTVAAVAAHLNAAGWRVAILSRGYGRRDEGEVRIISDGEGPLLGPRLAGDEPVLLAGMLPGVAVLVGAERSRAGRHALLRLDPPPDVFLLDDGFSHLRLRRDLDILVFPAGDPFAGGWLPPGGRLREPLAAAARADAVVLTGTPPEAAPRAGDELARALRPYGFRGPGFASVTVTEKPRRVPAGELPGTVRALLVSGIARPEGFAAAVRELGVEVAEHLAFGDHHGYGEASLARIAQAYHRHGANLVLVTGKDRVKLQGRLDLPLAEIPIRATPPPGFFTWLDERLAEIRGADGAPP